MSLYEGGRPVLRPLLAPPESRIGVPRSLEPRQQAALAGALVSESGGVFINPLASSTEMFLFANGFQITGAGAVQMSGAVKFYSATAAGTPASFSADYYIKVTDGSGTDYFIPAMAAAW